MYARIRKSIACITQPTNKKMLPGSEAKLQISILADNINVMNGYKGNNIQNIFLSGAAVATVVNSKEDD